MNSLIRYEEPLVSLSNIFDDFFNDGFFYNTGGEITRNSWPKVDIVENDNDYTIHADLPGLDKKDIKISVEDGVLSISGEKKEEKREKKKGRYFYYERSYGSFFRSFGLPENVNEKDINATYKNGLLELKLKKTEKAKPKAIEVKVD